MGVPNIHHRLENRVPRVGVFESGIGEHAAVPADMLDATVSRIF